MNLAEEIKSRITMTDVLTAYGLPVSRRGRIPCPLHHGEDNNFSYSDKWFKCFVCGESGSVIDFAMKLHGIDFRQAIVRLDTDFGLDLVKQPGSSLEAAEQRRRRIADLEAKRAERDALEAEARELCEKHRELHRAKLDLAPKSPDEPPCQKFLTALETLDRLEYRIKELDKKIREMR